MHIVYFLNLYGVDIRLILCRWFTNVLNVDGDAYKGDAEALKMLQMR